MNTTATNQLSISTQFGYAKTVDVNLHGSIEMDTVGFLVYLERAPRPWKYCAARWVFTRDRYFKTYEAMMAFVNSLPTRLEYNDKLMGYEVK